MSETTAELAAIRERAENPEGLWPAANVRLLVQDRKALLAHVDSLSAQLATAKADALDELYDAYMVSPYDQATANWINERANLVRAGIL
jgi:hypothetical protein